MHRAKLTRLDEIVDELRQRYEQRPRKAQEWHDKPNAWIHRLNNQDKGHFGAQLYVEKFGGEEVEWEIGEAGNRKATYDVRDGDSLIEAKLSTLTKTGVQRRYQWNFYESPEDWIWTDAWLVAVGYDSVRAFLVPKGSVKMTYGKKDGARQQAIWRVNEGNPDPHDWLVAFEVR